MSSSDDTRLSVAHMATSLYCERVEEDAKQGQALVYRTNPDARALYFKGVHDALLMLDTWVEGGLAPNTLAMFIEALQQQTKDGPMQPLATQ